MNKTGKHEEIISNIADKFGIPLYENISVIDRNGNRYERDIKREITAIILDIVYSIYEEYKDNLEIDALDIAQLNYKKFAYKIMKYSNKN